MEDIFINHIHINKVRHLENLDIPLSATERQHLILTGRNGSGKTSFLLALKAYLKGVEGNWIYNIGHYRVANLVDKKNLLTITNKLNQVSDINEKAQLISQREILATEIHHRQNVLKSVDPLELSISHLGSLVPAYQKNDMILTYFDAKRHVDFRDRKNVV